MATFKQAAIEILSSTKKPLTPFDITRIALDRSLITTEGRTPEATMSATITSDIKVNGNKSVFSRAGTGRYLLNQSADLQKTLAQEKYFAQIEEDLRRDIVKTGYTGKAGEFAVCSELLFRGFSASIMSVDEGIDIIATKNDKVYYVQVKTANALDVTVNGINGTEYVFDLKVSSFERFNADNVYYIFVLRHADYYTIYEDQDEMRHYLIFPFGILDDFAKKAIFKKVGQNKRYRINVKIREGNFFLGNLHNNVTDYHNRWTLVGKTEVGI